MYDLFALDKLAVLTVVLSSVVGLLTVTKSVNLAIILFLSKMMVLNAVSFSIKGEWKHCVLLGMELLSRDKETKKHFQSWVKLFVVGWMICNEEYTPELACLVIELILNQFNISLKKKVIDLLVVLQMIVRFAFQRLKVTSLKVKLRVVMSSITQIQGVVHWWRQPSEFNIKDLQDGIGRYGSQLDAVCKKYGPWVDSATIVFWHKTFEFIVLGGMTLLYMWLDAVPFDIYQLIALWITLVVGHVGAKELKEWLTSSDDDNGSAESSESWTSFAWSSVRGVAGGLADNARNELCGNVTDNDRFVFGSLASFVVFLQNLPNAVGLVKRVKEVIDEMAGESESESESRSGDQLNPTE